jgi:hypothetical protein
MAATRSLPGRVLGHLPTAAEDWRLVGRTARLVVSAPGYAVLALMAAWASLTLFVVSLNVGFVADTVLGGALPLAARATIVLELYPFAGTFFGPLQGLLLVVVAAMTGLNVAMAVYHFREHGVSIRRGGTGALGVLLGTLGAGCAACGSAVLLGLLSLLGVSGSLLVLPLEGLEFAVGGIVVLSLSMYWLADGMRGGEINGCPIDI